MSVVLRTYDAWYTLGAAPYIIKPKIDRNEILYMLYFLNEIKNVNFTHIMRFKDIAADAELLKLFTRMRKDRNGWQSCKICFI